MRIAIVLILLIASLGILGARMSKSINLEQDCTGYLKRAADANTVDIAKKELRKATKYLEDHNLTAGYTSLFWRTPDEDIDFWYKNLKASESELFKVNQNTSGIEQTNLLMKLRETLMDDGNKGGHLTVPDGISRFPNNGLWAILTSLAVLALLFLICWGAVSLEGY